VRDKRCQRSARKWSPGRRSRGCRPVAYGGSACGGSRRSFKALWGLDKLLSNHSGTL